MVCKTTVRIAAIARALLTAGRWKITARSAPAFRSLESKVDIRREDWRESVRGVHSRKKHSIFSAMAGLDENGPELLMLECYGHHT